MRVAAQAGLYDPADDDPVLNGSVCTACGAVAFPPIGIGCEICGADADEMQPKGLTATGVVHAIADVALSPSKTPTPFTVAEIQLDDGPLIRAMIHPDASPSPVIAERVSARWSVVGRNDDGADIVEPAFLHTGEVAS